MRIAIVDDLEADRFHLLSCVTRWGKEHDMPLIPAPELFETAEDLLAVFDKDKYDIIFLDIYMHGMSGMDAAYRIRQTDTLCRIIFTTTSGEFAVDSYEVDASYYLVKPYGYEKLTAAMNRCGAARLEHGQSIKINGEHLLLHQIAYTEFFRRKVQVYFKDGRHREILMTWQEFTDLLKPYPYFCDCVRGILVNFEAVDKLCEDSFILHGGVRIPISRLKYKEVREQFLDWSYAKIRGDMP